MDERMTALRRELDENRRQYQAFCRALSTEELERPVPDSIWTVKGYIAHLATIDKTVGPWFEALLSGNTQAPSGNAGERFDIDKWNDGEVAKREARSLEEILREMDENRAAIGSALGQFDTAILDSTMHFGGDSKRPPAEVNFYQYLRAWVRHDPAHALDMLRALPERREDPMVKDWVGSLRWDDLDPAIVPQAPR